MNVKEIVGKVRHKELVKAANDACRCLTSTWAKEMVRRAAGMYSREEVLDSMKDHLSRNTHCKTGASDEDFTQALIGLARFWRLKPKEIKPHVKLVDRLAARALRKKQAEEQAEE